MFQDLTDEDLILEYISGKYVEERVFFPYVCDLALRVSCACCGTNRKNSTLHEDKKSFVITGSGAMLT